MIFREILDVCGDNSKKNEYRFINHHFRPRASVLKGLLFVEKSVNCAEQGLSRLSRLSRLRGLRGWRGLSGPCNVLSRGLQSKSCQITPEGPRVAFLFSGRRFCFPVRKGLLDPFSALSSGGMVCAMRQKASRSLSVRFVGVGSISCMGFARSDSRPVLVRVVCWAD